MVHWNGDVLQQEMKLSRLLSAGSVWWNYAFWGPINSILVSGANKGICSHWASKRSSMGVSLALSSGAPSEDDETPVSWGIYFSFAAVSKQEVTVIENMPLPALEGTAFSEAPSLPEIKLVRTKFPDSWGKRKTLHKKQFNSVFSAESEYFLGWRG